MGCMSTYDETRHTRGGNPANTGEYSTKANSAPETQLPAVKMTLAEYGGKQARNYSRMPTIDVPIIENEYRHCANCGEAVYREAGTWSTVLGRTLHLDGTDEHYVTARPKCAYCGTDDPAEVSFHQRNWSDETECTRCGGITGYAIGD